jgi:hypothetical protein
MPAKPKRQLKPIRTIDAAEYKRDLLRRVRKYEHFYEVSTETMREMVRQDARLETNEVVKWFHAAWALERIERHEKGMAGSDSTATSKSTKTH